MAESLTLDWIFENELRAYPFKMESIKTSNGSTCVLTNDTILDAQFVFNSVEDNLVYLETITVSGNEVTIKVNGTNFLFLKDGTFPQYLRLPSGHLMVAGKGIITLPEGIHNFSVNQPAFEASTVHEFSGPWLGVSSLTVNNTALVGEVTFKEGFQFGLNFSDNKITFDVDGLSGIPLTCNTAPISEDLVNDCAAILSFINGVGPTEKNTININPGSGILILNDPPNHRIYVGFTFNSTTDICKPIPDRPD
jgi:hypothetical protein